MSFVFISSFLSALLVKISRLVDYEEIKRPVLVLFVGSLCPRYLRVPNNVKREKNEFVTYALRIPVNLGAAPSQLVET